MSDSAHLLSNQTPENNSCRLHPCADEAASMKPNISVSSAVDIESVVEFLQPEFQRCASFVQGSIDGQSIQYSNAEVSQGNLEESGDDMPVFQPEESAQSFQQKMRVKDECHGETDVNYDDEAEIPAHVSDKAHKSLLKRRLGLNLLMPSKWQHKQNKKMQKKR